MDNLRRVIVSNKRRSVGDLKINAKYTSVIIIKPTHIDHLNTFVWCK